MMMIIGGTKGEGRKREEKRDAAARRRGAHVFTSCLSREGCCTAKRKIGAEKLVEIQVCVALLAEVRGEDFRIAPVCVPLRFSLYLCPISHQRPAAVCTHHTTIETVVVSSTANMPGWWCGGEHKAAGGKGM
mmetsp:Transcript_60672/g.88912  ORF Transcript_60672/g.88912 Transcript_60672/m.88912 type:complete len:132 (-) Transcript_60672:189-584(-)|eukprot:CAMPEP_0179484842 /NCGR_PEP_ID=MMETSP0799-20121207/61641_1 /TAXON_ID=46947 /ORGANISM="Geminigera cryophila, Strain CCMP2564" /LENGTH=131 /DNA_ID=CAMNT_0021298995 /DNA_START=278 /DNA_END=673 /DNA_ORIENTATION=+